MSADTAASQAELSGLLAQLVDPSPYVRTTAAKRLAERGDVSDQVVAAVIEARRKETNPDAKRILSSVLESPAVASMVARSETLREASGHIDEDKRQAQVVAIKAGIERLSGARKWAALVGAGAAAVLLVASMLTMAPVVLSESAVPASDGPATASTICTTHRSLDNDVTYECDNGRTVTMGARGASNWWQLFPGMSMVRLLSFGPLVMLIALVLLLPALRRGKWPARTFAIVTVAGALATMLAMGLFQGSYGTYVDKVAWPDDSRPPTMGGVVMLVACLVALIAAIVYWRTASAIAREEAAIA